MTKARAVGIGSATPVVKSRQPLEMPYPVWLGIALPQCSSAMRRETSQTSRA